MKRNFIIAVSILALSIAGISESLKKAENILNNPFTNTVQKIANLVINIGDQASKTRLSLNTVTVKKSYRNNKNSMNE